MRKILSLLLVCSLLLCNAAFAAVVPDDSIQSSNYFASYGTSLLAQGSGKIYISFSTTAVGVADQIGVANFVVQKLNSIGSWEDVTPWYPGTYGYNTTSHSFARVMQGVKGETYRVVCIFYCIKNGTGESKSYTSLTITAT